MHNDSSLKEYYINIQRMYNNAVNMLTAINQSLRTTASEIEVKISDTDDTESVIRIPSFLYLENKIDEMYSNFNSIFNIPKDGEAWFTKTDSVYKLNLVRSNTSPVTPEIKLPDSNSLYASVTDNSILKDMVSPKTYIKFNISANTLPSNITKIVVNKIAINDSSIFNALQNGKSTIPYAECMAKLYTLQKGIDYETYEKVLDLPIVNELYKSKFNILEVFNDFTVNTDNKSVYRIKLDTLEYGNQEDTAIKYMLKVDDILCLGNDMVTYKITKIENGNIIEIENEVGHAFLTTTAENDVMFFKIYKPNDVQDNYVQIPLEENQYIIVFISTVWNNVRSEYADGVFVNLANVKMVDKNNQKILDSNGNQYHYLSYYKDYCTNIGDLIDGISKVAYSQITNYNIEELRTLLTGENTKQIVTASVSLDNIKVVAINKHLVDDSDNKDIVNLHNQKNEINSKLQTCQSNIDQVYSTLLTTDFSQTVTVSQSSLQEELNTYYSDRISLYKQLNAVVDNINSKLSSLNTSESKTKYRIRGVCDVFDLENFVKNFNNVDIIGMDVEYKYISTSKDTATLTNINDTIFTNWNKMFSIEKDRFIEFNDNGYGIKYVDYNGINNIIKWNQIDIPIRQGEDVVIRVRYKYSVGQPFINLYTPWSNDVKIIFPAEFKENLEIANIIATNNKDMISSTFSKTLINDGYTEHIQNKILSNEQVFFHSPDNIYSGFNTAENNLLSLKDKLTQMTNDIEQYKQFIDSLTNSSIEVYITYDNNNILLSNNSTTKINVYNTDHVTDKFIKKEMNIVIKNTGSSRVNLYSIFPGNTDEYLICNNNENYLSTKSNYERVPVFVGNKLSAQTLGQWLYFRQNNPYTKEDIYFNTIRQNAYDFSAALTDSIDRTSFKDYFNTYINKNNSQALLGFRNNLYISGFNYNALMAEINNSTGKTFDDILATYLAKTPDKVEQKLSALDFFIYKEYNDITEILVTHKSNSGTPIVSNYILRYEDFILNTSTPMSLSNENSLSEVVNNKYIVTGSLSAPTPIINSNELVGAFLYPNLLSSTQITIGADQKTKPIEVGASLTIPIVFEYFVNSTTPAITKSLFFDIKNNTTDEPLHFMVEITGNYDYTLNSETYVDSIQSIKS